MTTTTTTDIRLEAWGFGRALVRANGNRQAGAMGLAYRYLEGGNATAVRVFDAMRRDEWGVKAAYLDGIRGVEIAATDRRTGVTIAWTGTDLPPVPARRRPVAANGGTI